MDYDKIENFGAILVVVAILAFFGWVFIVAPSSNPTQSEEEYYEQFSCPSGKEYDFGYEACVEPGNEYDGAFEACVEQEERDMERYGEWVSDTYDCQRE